MLKVVVDANVLISALLSPKGPIADVLFEARGRIQLLSPVLLKEELILHADRLALEAGVEKELFRQAIDRAMAGVRIVPDERIHLRAKEQADVLALHIDPKDVAYVALSISQQAPLWTVDKKLIRGLVRQGVRIAIDIHTMRHLIEQV